MTVQKGPWSISDRGNLEDSDKVQIRVTGVALPHGRVEDDDPCGDNSKLIASAPEMAHVLNQLMFECNTVESMYKMVAKLHQKHPIIKDVTMERRKLTKE